LAGVDLAALTAKEFPMSKELFISSSPHETKVAVLEDDQLVEVFFQRDTDVGLVGGIYKGRVSRVLPGMQSAFVDIGLERDAFLYVSDFFEDSEEYDRLVAEAEGRVGRLTEEAPAAASRGAAPAVIAPVAAEAGPSAAEAGKPGPVPAVPVEEPASGVSEGSTTGVAAPETMPGPSPTAPAGTGEFGRRPQELRGRGRRRRRGRMFGGKPEFRPQRPVETSPGSFEVLPGESLAKYGRVSIEGEAGISEAGATTEATVRAAGSEEAEPKVESSAEAQVSEDRAESASEQTAPPESSLTGEPSEPESSADYPNLAAFSEAGESSEPGEGNEGAAISPGPGAAEPGAQAEERVESELLAGNLRMAPVNFEPDAPIHGRAAAPGQTPLDQVEATAVEALPETARDITPNAQPEPAADSSAEEEAAGTSEAPSEMRDSGAPTSVEGAEAPSISPGGEPVSDRTYTVREQHQRPRFAPRRGRRGRGRFGPRGPRPDGGPRRSDYPRSGNEQPVQINELLKEGQEILVQIAKEPLGTKGARITSHVALPGRYLVYMPTIHHIGVSRKIASEEERLRLRNVILEHRGALAGGIIVRTAAAGRSEEELKADLQFLGTLWADIRTKAERAKAPALIHRDLTLVERLLRDILSPDFKSVRVDNEIEYQNALEFVHRFQPSLVGHVKLYTKDAPMFEEFGIQAEIDKALKPKVWLRSGGYIVINQTEALVAIDVNTGKYVGKTNRLEDTIVKTNIDAVKEIVRQVRLRDLGGIIVIDFIDMDDRRNRLKVVQALEEALRADRAPTKILSFNEFGLVALTRKRVKQSLERTLSESCPYCSGSGWVKSVNTVCYEIMEEAKKMARDIEGDVLTFRVNPEVARALKSREGVLISELESLTGKDVVIKSDPAVHQERYEIY
jgi:ribonuclease G